MEKIKIDLYVKGCISTEKYAACHETGSLTGGVAEDDPKYDLSTAIIVEGDMHISSLTVMPGRRLAASGTIFLREPRPADGRLLVDRPLYTARFIPENQGILTGKMNHETS